MKKIYSSKKELVEAVKSSFIELQDSIMGADLGWWFGERPDAIDEIGRISDLDEALGLGEELLSYVEELLEGEELEKAKARINAWSARWCSR